MPREPSRLSSCSGPPIMTFHEFRKVKEKDRQGHFKNRAPKKRKVNENKDSATAKVVTIKVGLTIYRKDSTSTVSYVGDNPPPFFYYSSLCLGKTLECQNIQTPTFKCMSSPSESVKKKSLSSKNSLHSYKYIM